MYDHNQFDIPESFVALFIAPGQTRPSASRRDIAQRYDLCEDLAQQLVELSRAQWQDLGIAECDVLARCHGGLLAPPAVVDPPEAAWVVRRLAELQGWEDPVWLAPT